MPGIVFARGSLAASGRYWATRLLGHPSRDALADRDAQLVRGLVDVLADLALHRHRDEVRARDAVDPDVVEVDQLAQLRGDRDADLAHAGEVVQPRAELLDGLQLGRPGRHLLEVLGRADGDAGLGRERGEGLELIRRPGMRRVVVDVEQAEQLGAVHHRRRAQRVVALLDHGGPDVGPARVVGVVDGEQRSTRGDGRGGQRPVLDGPHRARYPADRLRLTSAASLPSGRRMKTAARSASNRTMAWSTRPIRMRSRSSRLPMSPATRRRASARWSRWRTSSSRCAAVTIVPMASARTAARSRSVEPRPHRRRRRRAAGRPTNRRVRGWPRRAR